MKLSIHELAISDPVAAYGIWMGIPRVPFYFSLFGSFSTLSTNVGLPVKAASPLAAIAQRVWIRDINYSLQVPNINPNNVFKPEFDARLKESPGISVKLAILGGPPFPESMGFEPLEGVTNLIRADRWPVGWPLFPQQVVQGTFVLTQSPGGLPSGMGPYNFVVTFNGWQFENDNEAGTMDPLLASEILRREGVLLVCDVKPGCAVPLVEVAQ